MPIRTACPACDAPYNLADRLEGKTVKCKGCQEPFVVKPLTTKKTKAAGVAPAPSKKKAPAPKEDIDRELDDEEDDRPVRQSPKKPKKKSKKRAKSGAALWIFLAVGGGVLLLLLIGGGIGLMYVLKGGGPSPTAPGNNQTPGLLGGLIPQTAPANVTEETFDKLRTSMNEDDVVAIMGTPTERHGPLKGLPPPPPPKPGVITEYQEIKLTWESGKNNIVVRFGPQYTAWTSHAEFDDGQGGWRVLDGNKFDQLCFPFVEQRVYHKSADGRTDSLAPPPAPPGPSKVTDSNTGILGIGGIIVANGPTVDQVLKVLGEEPTQKLGPQPLPDGTESADAWLWKNGSGYLEVFFDANGKAVRIKRKNLPLR